MNIGAGVLNLNYSKNCAAYTYPATTVAGFSIFMARASGHFGKAKYLLSKFFVECQECVFFPLEDLQLS
jgi:hypothetical protein